MSRIAIRARAVDVEQHELRLGVRGAPVVLGHVEELLVVEDVVEFGIEHGAVVGEVTAEGRGEEQVQRRVEALREHAAHRRHQLFGRREVLSDDQVPWALGVDHVEQSLTLIVGVDVVDLAGRRGGTQYVGQLDPALVGEHEVSSGRSGASIVCGRSAVRRRAFR